MPFASFFAGVPSLCGLFRQLKRFRILNAIFFRLESLPHVHTGVLRKWDALKVFNLVIAPIAVDVMDCMAVRNLAVMVRPYPPV
jgi:hypothetical protein